MSENITTPLELTPAEVEASRLQDIASRRARIQVAQSELEGTISQSDTYQRFLALVGERNRLRLLIADGQRQRTAIAEKLAGALAASGPIGTSDGIDRLLQSGGWLAAYRASLEIFGPWFDQRDNELKAVETKLSDFAKTNSLDIPE